MSIKPINWNVLTTSQEGVVVPTYGNYGGPGYSGGAVGGLPVSPVAPVDLLDTAFQAHDQASLQAQTNLDQAKADLKLINDIHQIPDAAMSPEAHLYAAGAVFAMIEEITVADHHPELLPPADLLGAAELGVHHLSLGRPQPEPGERAGFVHWLGTTAGLADSFGFGSGPAHVLSVATAVTDPLAAHVSLFGHGDFFV
jgi:hypothetical protein